MSNPCLIIEWSDALAWTNLYGNPALQRDPLRIPVDRRPTILQPDRETAELEAKRLAAAHPGRRFAVFEACVAAMAVDVPSHVTVGGQVWLTRKVPALVTIDDSEIPF